MKALGLNAEKPPQPYFFPRHRSKPPRTLDHVQHADSSYLPVLFGLVLGLSGCDLLGLGMSSSKGGEKVERRAKENAKAPLSFVGRQKCKICHEEVLQSYAWSAHDRSLELPVKDALEAPFSGEKLSKPPLNASFGKDAGSPVIRSGGERPVTWTIGFFPHQSYLVPGEKGRVLPFSAVYDTREKGDGGKRWYVPVSNPTDLYHALGRDRLNFNSDCGGCHSTGFSKNYDYKADTYESEFREIDVSCEACHGPASLHVRLAEETGDQTWPNDVENFGFSLPLTSYAQRRWVRGPDDKVAQLAGDGKGPPERTAELLSCAPCHSSRVDWGPAGTVDDPGAFANRYALELITEDSFFADGRSRGDVSTLNAFMQTRMHAAGVVCSDCHNPHSGTLRSPVADLCVTCHDPGTYEDARHTLHSPNQDVSCVDCHMPERRILGVDMARDHRFTSPRPDLTISLQLPSACESCHPHRPKWAAAIIDSKFGKERPPSVAPTFRGAEQGDPEAPEHLSSLLFDRSAPEIVRATALLRWAKLGRMTPKLAEAIEKASRDEGALVRRAAARSHAFSPGDELPHALERLFEDPVRTVRIAAALASLRYPSTTALDARTNEVLAEAKEALLFRSDRFDALLSLARLEERIGSEKSAERLYALAAERFPQNAEVFVQWSLARQRSNKPDTAQDVVLRGLTFHPKDAALQFSRGRYLVRQEKIEQALPLLHGAFEDAPRSHRKEYGYVYAVTIHQAGDWAEALAILRLLKKEYPEEQDIQEALDIFEEKRGK